MIVQLPLPIEIQRIGGSMKTIGIVLALVFVVGIAGFVSAAYGQNPNTGNSPSTTNVFEGKLSKIDTDKKMITVTGKDEKGRLTEMSFKYNDATEISGGDRTIQGLTGKQGEDLKITFRVADGDNTATKIEWTEDRKTP